MKTWFALSLTALLWPLAGHGAEETVTIHRCVDSKGRITLQDDACPPGSQASTRQMQRPRDPAPTSAPAATATPAAEPEPTDFAADYPPIPPPPMFRCTSYDGLVRHSENYDPNPRCEPLGLYARPGQLSNEQSRMCRWVEDSCVRLSDAQACAVWRKKQVEAKSKALHAFSDTAAYWKSEVIRISQVIDESCR